MRLRQCRLGNGNDEMEAASEHRANFQSDGHLEGEFCAQNGDDIPLTARRQTISTACSSKAGQCQLWSVDAAEDFAWPAEVRQDCKKA